MEPLLTGMLAGAAVDAGVGIFNAANQWSNQEYMKKMQKEAWDREDTATQRRVVDLKRAGLSPVLAAGSAAQSSSPIRTEAPQINGIKGLETASTMLNLAQAKTQMAQTTAQTKLTEMQANKVALENEYLKQTMDTRTSTAQAGLDKILADTGVAKESKRGMEITNAFNELANPDRLKILQQEVKNLSEEEKIKKLTQLQQKETISKTAQETAKIVLEQSEMKQLFPMKWDKLSWDLALAELSAQLTKVQTLKTVGELKYQGTSQVMQTAKDVTSIVTDILGSLRKDKYNK